MLVCAVYCLRLYGSIKSFNTDMYFLIFQCRYEEDQECTTVNEEICSNTFEEQCAEVLEEQCETIEEEQCISVTEEDCQTSYAQVRFIFVEKF